MAEIEWLSADAAAEILGLSRRRVLEYAQAGAIKSQVVRDPDTSQMTKQVHAGDVERLREERENPRPQPSQALEKASGAAKSQAAALPALLEALVSARREWWPLYLNLEQAMEFTGLGETELRRCAKGAPRGPRGALVYRRKDLEEL
jgi:hypothetical protein